MSQWWFTPRLFGWAELNSVWCHMVRCKHWKTPQTFPRSAKFLHLPYLHSSDLTNAHWWLISFKEHHLWAQEGTGGKMQMQSAVVSTGRRKKSESPGQSREDLNSPLLPHQHTTSPCLPPITDTHRFISTCLSTIGVELIAMFISASHHPEWLSAPKSSFILQILTTPYRLLHGRRSLLLLHTLYLHS